MKNISTLKNANPISCLNFDSENSETKSGGLKKATLNNILAFSRALEVKSSNQIDDIEVMLN